MALPAKPNQGGPWIVWGDAVHAIVNDLIGGLQTLTDRLDAIATGGLPQTTTLTVTGVGSGSVSLAWTAAAGATGYTITTTLASGGGTGNVPAAASKAAGDTTHTVTGLTNGTAYQFTLVIGPSGATRSVGATPTAAADAVTVSTVPGDGQVVVNWTGSATATGYLVGRNGTDTSGSGPWSTTDPASARSRTFLSLSNGTAYVFTVTPQPGGTPVTATATPVAGTGGTPTPPPAGAGAVWLSGAGDDQASNTAGGGFGTWRGEPATYARMWADASIPAMQGLDMAVPYKSANWTGILDYALGGPRDGQTWSSAATGGMDSIWRGQCQKIHADWWTNLKGVHLSMSHEFSGTWYPWSVNSGNLSAFKTAWQRWYNIVQEELVSKGRKAKVVCCYNFDNQTSITAQNLYPGSAYVDIIGVDFYNMWWGGSAASGLNTQALWDSHLNDTGNGPKGLGAWFDFAATNGKPITVPEWGTSPQATVEAPLFVTNMRNYFASKAPVDAYNPAAGKVAGEAYFNTWAQCRLNPTTSLPQTRDAYKAARWGQV